VLTGLPDNVADVSSGEARLDIIRMDDDVIIWVRQSEVLDSHEILRKGIPDDTVKFNAFVS
jgi:hypothetical protein